MSAGSLGAHALLYRAIELQAAGALKIIERPEYLSGTRVVTFVADPGGPFTKAQVVMVVWSQQVLHLMLHPFAGWHDDHEGDHCRTFTEAAGCRCDVEPS